MRRRIPAGSGNFVRSLNPNNMKRTLLTSFILAALGYSVFSNFAHSQSIAGGVWNTYFYCNGNLTSVGNNAEGQLGNGTAIASDSVPNNVIGPAGVFQMAGSYQAIFVAGDSTVWSTGQNYGGQCGNGTNSTVNPPAHIAGLTGVVKVAAGESHTLILKSDGTVWACGSTTNGEFGNGMTSDSNVPVQCSITNVVDIACGSYHSVFLKADGTVWTCGYNLYGQLGLGFSNTSPNALPAQVDTITNGIAVTAGDQGTMVVTADGYVWAFGYGGGYGKFATGGVNPGNTPMKSLITNVVDAACSRYHSIFIKADGTAWGAGSNYYGQLGDGTTIDADSAAIQISSLTNIADIAVGYQHSIFLKGDGTVWVVGNNNYGQLGDGTTDPHHTPIQLTVCTTSGIEDLSANSLNVYPNPAMENVFVEISEELEGTVELINMNGSVMLTQKFMQQKMNLFIGDLTPGVYMVRVTNQNGSSVKKMIKN
jgi:alpha-tubulin suppressor-like RCC1 family protein